MSGGITMTLRVTPAELITKASQVTTDISAMDKEIKKLISEVRGTTRYWKGEAGDAQRKKMEDQVSTLDAMIKRLNTYPERLKEISGLYDTAENENFATASATKTSIVMH